MTAAPRGDGTAEREVVSLADLIRDLPAADEAVVVHTATDRMTLGRLRRVVNGVAERLREAGVRAGTPVGGLVDTGVAGIVVMFAVWTAGGVYVPINRRMTPAEVAALVSETPVDLLIGAPADLDRQLVAIPMLELHTDLWRAVVRTPLEGAGRPYDASIALVLRTSGTTGRPKAVILQHAGTLAALDSSLRKLRGGRATRPEPQAAADELRVNLIPVSLALWAGIFNTVFALRAGFGVVLLDRFTPRAFAEAVRRHHIRSTVLAPAMIKMLVDADADELGDLAPLRIARSITAPLSPEIARRFHDRFGVLVLNSYGQTELGGEVVGWTVEDIRTFGTAKLGAVGRPYDDVEVRIVDDSGALLSAGELGQVHVRSPFRMHGYASVQAADGVPRDGGALTDRLVDGFLHTGDLGRLDADGFLWIEGRMSDMVNRGGLKVFPDEVEEVLRRHPSVRDAAVAGVPDERLGEVPHAWIVPAGQCVDDEALADWCRAELAPYKVPAGFSVVDSLPRSDVGKLLRRELVAHHHNERAAVTNRRPAQVRPVAPE